MLISYIYTPMLQGFFLGASLIIAIGAQNAFVLRLGLQRLHVLPIVLICSFSDAILIAAGVAGMGTLVRQSQLLLTLITWGGFAFLLFYGLQAFIRAFKSNGMHVSKGESIGLKSAILTVLAFTYLNPHVYLDTVMLVGSLSARWLGFQQILFAIGAIAASFVWFFALGYGARVLTPLFEKAIAWRILDFIIGVIMWLLAWSLIHSTV